ncbi:chemotaxis protein CheW [Janthinobacterium fluminis]|uniref:Chemotaxis protein CheW n=1 Tax=Janthinobacterium fluminis TaxID=2987524 RepID=A0ABT5K1H2_9BURK|nr:chemotaxis protein CheW [Janthinobacterium fluminis]MDC8758556.1 chemotaxis protein CheW [Janthinobacterium fluminis]
MRPGAAAGQALDALRRQFDDGFAQAPAALAAAPLALLAIRAGDCAYALRLAQIAGLHADRHITALPGALPALLGVSGFRGQVAPVYDLAALLGHERAAAPRWLVLVRGPQPLALAFDAFENHFTAAAEQIMPAGAARPWATVEGELGARPLIELPALFDDIRRQADLASRQRSA